MRNFHRHELHVISRNFHTIFASRKYIPIKLNFTHSWCIKLKGRGFHFTGSHFTGSIIIFRNSPGQQEREDNNIPGQYRQNAPPARYDDESET